MFLSDSAGDFFPDQRRGGVVAYLMLRPTGDVAAADYALRTRFITGI